MLATNGRALHAPVLFCYDRIMTLCFFGDYDPNYTRIRNILTGLENLGVRVLHVNTKERSWKKYLELWKRHRALTEPYDVMIVAFGHSRWMPEFARLIARKPIIWEALFSQYDNWVFDRKLAKPRSLKAYYYWFLDWLGCRVSDLVLLDTHHHTEYFTETFGVPEHKLDHVYAGGDTNVFYPRPRTKRSPNFEVEFHGYFFPMQGADVIVRAAKLLEGEHIHFTMTGSGQEVKAVHALAEELGVRNITFNGFSSQKEIAEIVCNADVSCGLLGDVPRVVRAIPLKIWESAAMERVGISADTASLREVFTPGVDVIGVPPGDHAALAQAILELKKSGKAEEMGKAARATFLKWGTPEAIGQSLIDIIHKRFSLTKN